MFHAPGTVSVQPKGGDLCSHRTEAFRAIARRRQAWFDAQPDLDPARLVFINDTGAFTKMAHLQGQAPCGQRYRAAMPRGHWKTTTVMGALRLGGMTAPLPARKFAGLWIAIADTLPQFTPVKCATYFTACGYEPERAESALKPAKPRNLK